MKVIISLIDKHLLRLTRRPKYMKECQSRFTFCSTKDIIEREYQMASSILRNCLMDGCLLAFVERAKLYFISIINLFREFYTT